MCVNQYKMNNKIISLIILLLSVSVLPVLAERAPANDAGAMKVIENAAAKLRRGKGIEANFTFTSPDGKSSGKITMSGDMFMIHSADMRIWYDGTTQWSYAPSRKEVDITEPTPEELSQVNPYVIINNLRTNYTARRLPSQGQYRIIELSARNARNDLRTAVLKVDKNGFPVSIGLTMRNGSKATINVKDVKELTKAPGLQSFRFDKKMAPGAEIVDLR